jgi:hypothetical protein
MPRNVPQNPNPFICADSLNSVGTGFGLSRLGLCFENRNRSPKGHKVPLPNCNILRGKADRCVRLIVQTHAFSTLMCSSTMRLVRALE